MKEALEEGVQYFGETDMKLCYCLFRFPQPDTGAGDSFRVLCIGPVMSRMIDAGAFAAFMKKQNVLPRYHQDFLEFFNRIPVIADMDGLNHSLNFTFEKLTGAVVPYRVISAESPGLFSTDYQDYSIPHDPGVATHMIEERYAGEDRLLSAVSAGNLKEAEKARYQFQQYKLLPRCPDSVRDKKNLLVVFNTLLRKAVQAGHVHPLHIDNLSRQFAVQIEHAFTPEQLQGLSQTMVRKYCMLVNNYSRQTCSPLVRSCMDYIDFHYMEELSLRILAENHSVSPQLSVGPV